MFYQWLYWQCGAAYFTGWMDDLDAQWIDYKYSEQALRLTRYSD
jgi:hypothetical protein